MSAPFFALAFAILVQLVSVVWFAAKMHAAVQSLEKTTDKISRTLDLVADKVHEHSTDIELLKLKVAL